MQMVRFADSDGGMCNPFLYITYTMTLLNGKFHDWGIWGYPQYYANILNYWGYLFICLIHKKSTFIPYPIIKYFRNTVLEHLIAKKKRVTHSSIRILLHAKLKNVSLLFLAAYLDSPICSQSKLSMFAMHHPCCGGHLVFH